MKLRTWQRAGLIVAAPALGLGLATPAMALAAPVTDPAGDVYNDEDEPVVAPYADLVETEAKKDGTKLVLTFKTAKPLSPAEDPNWNSDSSFADFVLDTNGDQKEDWDVEYGLDEDGDIYVDVYKLPAADDAVPACAGEGDFVNNANVATIDLKCIGSPTKLDFRTELMYDLDVNDPNSLAGYDSAPDEGFAKGF